MKWENKSGKLLIYGAGKRCQRLCRILYQANIEIIAVIDSNPDKWGSKIGNYQVESPKKISEFRNMRFCITIADVNAAKTIREELQQLYQFDLKKEVNYYQLILDVYRESMEIRQYILGKKLNDCGENSVLFSCSNGFVLGGIEAWTIGICEALIKSEKKNIYVISNKGTYDVPIMLEDHMVYVDIDQQERYMKNSIMNLIDAIMKKLPCKIITTQPDDMMVAAYLVKYYLPGMVEIISTIRGSNEQIYEAYIGFKECPDIYIGVSQDIRSDMIQRGIEPEKIYTMSVPFACEKALEHVYTEDSLLPVHIGYAGRMDGMEHSQKRMDLLLKLMLLLAEKKVDFHMELAGDGPVRQEMEKFVYDNNLDGNVKFLGTIDRSKIPSFWKRQDICINLADYEGRSHSIIEAMGNGAVPVVTATSGVREDITDDVNGYIVPLRDYHTMAVRIEYLAQHRERLSEMGKLAHDAVYPKSRMESHLKFWENILFTKMVGNINKRI